MELQNASLIVVKVSCSLEEQNKTNKKIEKIIISDQVFIKNLFFTSMFILIVPKQNKELQSKTVICAKDLKETSHQAYIQVIFLHTLNVIKGFFIPSPDKWQDILQFHFVVLVVQYTLPNKCIKLQFLVTWSLSSLLKEIQSI